jgi:hypothetical protein
MAVPGLGVLWGDAGKAGADLGDHRSEGALAGGLQLGLAQH